MRCKFALVAVMNHICVSSLTFTYLHYFLVILRILQILNFIKREREREREREKKREREKEREKERDRGEREETEKRQRKEIEIEIERERSFPLVVNKTLREKRKITVKLVETVKNAIFCILLLIIGKFRHSFFFLDKT
jgi:biopolymer transport protein ExbB/TolQ